MRGDKVTIVVDTGGGSSREFIVEAKKNGRKINVLPVRQGTISVEELTRGGNVVRTCQFQASRVIALIEEPADEEESTPTAPPTASLFDEPQEAE